MLPIAIARAVFYWLLLAWMILLSCVWISEILDFHAEFDTYRRVYGDPALYHAASWIDSVLHCVGVATQVRGWRTSQTSWFAAVVAAGSLGFWIANLHFGFIPICCG